MASWDFLDDIPMDKTHTLEQLTGRFQSVTDGLPELVKNSKDQYMRIGVSDRADRQVLVVASTRHKALGVIDFAGASLKDFDGWQTWSSRTAGQGELPGEIEAGHGNGGKAFMVRGSLGDSFMESCAGGKHTKMGFDNASSHHLYIPAYAREDATQVRGVDESDVAGRLSDVLTSFGLAFSDLPLACRRAFERRDAFTAVVIEDVRDWHSKRTATVQRLTTEIPTALSAHAQASLSIETCEVRVIADRKLLTPEPLAAEYPESLEGFEDLPAISVPSKLQDPSTGETVSTLSERGGSGSLQLRTSQTHLRMSDRNKPLNVIRARNARNIVGNWTLADLAPIAESAFIFGVLSLPALQGEHLAGADRMGFSDTPLVRSVQAWLSQQVEELAERIRIAKAAQHRPEDHAKATDALDRMRELMRRYIEGTTLGNGGSHGGGEGPEGSNPPKPPRPELGERVDEIILEQGNDMIALAVGTEIPLIFRAYEITESGERRTVAQPTIELESELAGIVALGNRSLRALARGSTDVRLRCPETGARSNIVLIEAVDCTSVDIITPGAPLKRGQRTRLTTSFHTSEGHRTDLLIQAWVDELDMGTLGRTGYFTAGHLEGTATCAVQYGDARTDVQRQLVSIGPEVAERPGSGGSDIPLILLCRTQAPGTEDRTPEQRTHPGGPEHATIIEEPQWANVVWVNTESHESRRVRRFGPSGHTRITTKTFTQFLALKCFEILKRLIVRAALAGDTVTEVRYTAEITQAEMDAAGFINDAYALADELTR